MNQGSTLLQDYRPYPFTLATVDLQIALDPSQTKVSARTVFCRNPLVADQEAALELDGEHLEIISVRVDQRALGTDEYSYDGRRLRIAQVPEHFTLHIETCISPENNTALEGLYLSAGTYCTQCEAQGFRRITCWPDRPDVLAVFTVTLIGPEASCPVLLANGNLVEQGRLPAGRHYAIWHDPFPKPSYLFALVAGDLAHIEDHFTTCSGRTVRLRIYVEEQNRDKCDHAMLSLKRAMRWDEEVYGLEYDLDIYMIVAVDAFNMGAMENKGLNIFNAKYVLAQPASATDSDYEGIEAVIAHEYFHNWTGNRVTCRDWFQLSLKEGLTVFRDQEFSADMGSRAVKRIQDANLIRTFQFREDSGPMAHPIRPESYMEINNFYTATVYNKGAEVIRMLHTLLGVEGFRKGMDLYFSRHDGQAVTCEDFLQAMQDANDLDLSQFHLWYSQAGTPELRVQQEYDAAAQEYILHLSQSCPSSLGQSKKAPLFMPLRLGLVNSQGQDIHHELLIFREAQAEFRFSGIQERPVLSLNRGFSAPIKVHSDCSEEDLAFLMAHDSDPFNRWDAGQQLALGYLLAGIRSWQQGQVPVLPRPFHQAFARLLKDQQSDPAFLALALSLPEESWISQQMSPIDPEAVFMVRQDFRKQLGQEHQEALWKRYRSLSTNTPYQWTAEENARRSLRNCCLAYLLAPEAGEECLALAVQQYHQADNMTDALAALTAVVNADEAAGEELLAAFYQQWQHDPLVVDKWLLIQARCTLPNTLERVKNLLHHPAFNQKNPNKVRALIGGFCSNLHPFHAADGSGYAFLADQVLILDALNPQVAARMLSPLTLWKGYVQGRQERMLAELQGIAAQPGLSPDVSELIAKSIQ